MSIFDREIGFEVDEGGPGRLVIRGTLRDTRLGDPIHLITLRAEVGLEDGRIHALEGEMPHVPHEDCREALQTLRELVGERIVPGFTQRVRDVVGSSLGCSHLAVLVTNMGNVSVQGRGALTVSRLGSGEEARRMMLGLGLSMGLPGSCYAWREDGPIMRLWREGDGRGGA